MGNQLCGIDQASGKDESMLHHHCDGVPDIVGGSVADQGLHDHYGCEVFVRKCVDTIWLSENLNE